jgi:hypothetical protein
MGNLAHAKKLYDFFEAVRDKYKWGRWHCEAMTEGVKWCENALCCFCAAIQPLQSVLRLQLRMASFPILGKQITNLGN